MARWGRGRGSGGGVRASSRSSCFSAALGDRFSPASGSVRRLPSSTYAAGGGGGAGGAGAAGAASITSDECFLPLPSRGVGALSSLSSPVPRDPGGSRLLGARSRARRVPRACLYRCLVCVSRGGQRGPSGARAKGSDDDGGASFVLCVAAVRTRPSPQRRLSGCVSALSPSLEVVVSV